MVERHDRPNRKELYDRGRKIVDAYFREESVLGAQLSLPTEDYVSGETIRYTLAKWGIISRAGRPSSSLSEATYFFTRMVQESRSVAAMYEDMPTSFKTSLSTLHRIFQRVVNGIVGRRATALFISPESNPGLVLIGRDVSAPRVDIGKPQLAVTVPATFSVRGEDPKISIRRVLQHEVFTGLAIEGNFPENVVPENPDIFGHLDIVDVGAQCISLSVPDGLLKYVRSYKIDNYQLYPVARIKNENFGGKLRAGMEEASQAYIRRQLGEINIPVALESRLNGQIIRLAQHLALGRIGIRERVPNLRLA